MSVKTSLSTHTLHTDTPHYTHTHTHTLGTHTHTHAHTRDTPRRTHIHRSFMTDTLHTHTHTHTQRLHRAPHRHWLTNIVTIQNSSYTWQADTEANSDLTETDEGTAASVPVSGCAATDSLDDCHHVISDLRRLRRPGHVQSRRLICCWPHLITVVSDA